MRKTVTKKPPRKTPQKASSAPALAIPKTPADAVKIKDEHERAMWNYLLGVENSEKLTDSQKMTFVDVCRSNHLNPLKKEVYAVPYAVKKRNHATGQWEETGSYDLGIITGYTTYLKRAQRSPDYLSYHVELVEKPTPMIDKKTFEIMMDQQGRTRMRLEVIARCTIFRKSKEKFVHEVMLSEYAQQNNFWRDKPLTMIKKVVIAQAHRLCYSEETDGMPYIYEEQPDLIQQLTAPQIIEQPEEAPEVVKRDEKTEKEIKSEQEKIKVACDHLEIGAKKLTNICKGLFPEFSDLDSLSVYELRDLNAYLNKKIDEAVKE